MATTVTVETSKDLPPKGSSRRNQLVAEIQAVMQARLNEPSVVVNLVRRK